MAGRSPKHDGITYNWPWLGPFVGFRYSTDFGKTWTQTPCTPEKPLFGETGLQGRTGQDRRAALRRFRQEHGALARRQGLPGRPRRDRDGANRRFGYNSWITGDEIYLLRVTPSIENMNDASKYEFFDGCRAGPQISRRSSRSPNGATTWAA